MSHTASNVWNAIGLLFSGLLIGSIIYYCLTKSEEPGKLLFKFILTFVVIGIGIAVLVRSEKAYWPVIAASFGLIVAITWARSIGAVVARPLENVFTGGNIPPEPAPLYSIAESKRSQSHYDEAVRLIRAELEKFPGDFAGLMLMATIQAENLNDIQAAQVTVEHLVADKKRPPQAVASALHALADWHLRLEDPDSARTALDRIVQMYPDSPVSQIASQRIARLTTKAEMTAMHHRGPIAVRVGARDVGLRTDIKPVAEADPGEIAAGYVRQLEKHPLDTEAREKLAMIYLEHFQRPDLALDQFEQLADQPNESPRRIAHWLNLVAAVHIQRNDLASAQDALRRIIQKFPGTAPAQMATTRLAGLEGELKGIQAASSVKLGSYGHDLGLKGKDSES